MAFSYSILATTTRRKFHQLYLAAEKSETQERWTCKGHLTINGWVKTETQVCLVPKPTYFSSSSCLSGQMTQQAWEWPDRSSCILVLAFSCFPLHAIHRPSRVPPVPRLGDLTQLDYKWKTIRAVTHFNINFKSIPFTLFWELRPQTLKPEPPQAPHQTLCRLLPGMPGALSWLGGEQLWLLQQQNAPPCPLPLPTNRTPQHASLPQALGGIGRNLGASLPFPWAAVCVRE